MNPAFDLTGKTALVTGSTRGIGLAIARGMIAAGARVVISSEDAADTARIAAELGQPGIACAKNCCLTTNGNTTCLSVKKRCSHSEVKQKNENILAIGLG